MFLLMKNKYRRDFKHRWETLKSIMRRHISLLDFWGVLSAWQVAGLLKLLPKFILPTPLEILQSLFVTENFSGTIVGQPWGVASTRFGLGVLIACIMAVLDSLGWLNDLIYPMMGCPDYTDNCQPLILAGEGCESCPRLLDYLDDSLLSSLVF